MLTAEHRNTVVQLPTFRINYPIELRFIDLGHRHDVLVADGHTTLGEGSHRQLRLIWDTDLADDQDVEGAAQCIGNLKPDRDATAGKGVDNRIVGSEPDERLPELLPGPTTIGEPHAIRNA